jgi:hypothetical protein
LKHKHKASSKEITEEFKERRKELEENPTDLICQENYKIAFAKVTLLEKY